MTSLARAERARLCDTAAQVGAEAPTLCGDWTVRDLLVHLIVRESDPIGAPGIVVPRLGFLTDRASERVGHRGFDRLVADVRHPAPWSPSRIGPLDAVANALEYFVHHEDIRRAQAEWEPRTLTDAEQDTLWRLIGTMGRGLVRKAHVPVTIRRTDTGAERVLAGGAGPTAVVAGDPAEIVLFCYGRQQSRVEVSGPGADRLRGTSLGL